LFVAPTKALVNQVSAEIDARYGAVWGQFTQDYQVNVDRCQILVTVPQVLRQLLLSPAREKWRARIFYVVFDEVHMLAAKDESGTGYEHSLLLNPAPFLALSATVGGVTSCYEWMKSIQPDRKPVFTDLPVSGVAVADAAAPALVSGGGKKNKKQKRPKIDHAAIEHAEAETKRVAAERAAVRENALPCQLILHRERFCDLSHFVFDAKAKSFARINRCALFDRALCAGSVFTSVTLAPRESLELYTAMRTVVLADPHAAGDAVAARIDTELHPDRYFRTVAADGLVFRAHTEQYRVDLQAELASWDDAQSQRVFAVLSAPVHACLQQYDTPHSPPRDGKLQAPEHERSFHKLADSLAAEQMLPALMFSMDAHDCEAFMVQELKRLEVLEWKKKSHADHISRVKTLDREMTAVVKKIKDAEGSKGSKNTTRTIKEIELVIQKLQDEKDNIGSELVFLEGIDPDCSYLKEGESMDHATMSYWLERLEKHGITRNSPLVRCLLRGFGIHHDGLPRAYKLLVETMFRSAQLKFVIATKTLGLGMNECMYVCMYVRMYVCV
jgi:superfamily II RNA helicase